MSTTYDRLGRATSIASGGVTLEQYAYDKAGEAGLLDSASSFYNSTELKIDTLGYDQRGRPTGYNYVVPSIIGFTSTNGLAGTYTFDQFTYRRDDQLTSMRTPVMSNMTSEIETTQYSTLGVPIGVTGSSKTLVSGTTFTNGGRIASRTFGPSTDALKVVRTYDWNQTTGRLNWMKAEQNGVVLQRDDMWYNPGGDLNAVSHDRVGTTADHTECYGYDDRGRLKTAFTNATVAPTADCGVAASPTAGPSPYNQTYSYDEIGNMLTGPAGSYSYPTSGAGVARPHAPTTAGTATMAWRADGTLQTKMVAGVTSSYVFDALNHLSQVTKAGVDTKMVYWPGGERALLSDTNGVHLYLGSKAERHANTNGTTTQRYYYTLGGTTVGTRSLTTPATGSTWEFLFGDVRGSVTLTVGYGATATASQWYSPYGAKRGTPTIGSTTRGYIGQHTDTATGLNYLNNRYQDPATGVFLSVDPLVAKTGEPYLYGSGNPTTLSDPTGLCSSPMVAAVPCPGPTGKYGGGTASSPMDGWSACNGSATAPASPTYCVPEGPRSAGGCPICDLADDMAVAADVARDLVQRLSKCAFGDVVVKAICMSHALETMPGGSSARELLNAIPTAVAFAYADAWGGSCEATSISGQYHCFIPDASILIDVEISIPNPLPVGPDGVQFNFDFLIRQTLIDSGGMTVGDVFLSTELPDRDDLELLGHEWRHSWQWAGAGPSYPALYGLESAGSTAATGSYACGNRFEIDADLVAGGYTSCGAG